MTNEDNGSDHIALTDLGQELVRTDWNKYEQPTLGIIEAIAGLKDSRPTDLPPLGNKLDVDALNTLLTGQKEESAVTVSFEYEGLLVTVDQSGRLVIESPSEQ